MINKNYYTYVYFDKTMPIYVGKGCGNRSNKHLQKSHNNHLNNKIKKMLSENNQPIIKIIPVNNEDEAFELEKFLIQEIGRYDLNEGTLLNHTDGGDSGPRMTTDAAKKAYQTKLKNGTYSPPPISKKGRKCNRPKFPNGYSGHVGMSEETKNRMRKPKSESHSLNISLAKKGKSNPYALGKKYTFGRIWITDGFISKMIYPNEQIPFGFKKGRK